MYGASTAQGYKDEPPAASRTWGLRGKCMIVFLEILAKAPGGNSGREGPVLPMHWHRCQQGVPRGFFQDRTHGRSILSRGHSLAKAWRGEGSGLAAVGQFGGKDGGARWVHVSVGTLLWARWFWMGLQQGFLNQG